MVHSTEPRLSKDLRGYPFFSFARKFGVKYRKKRLNTNTKRRTDAIKTGTRRVAKNCLIYGVLIGNKIVDKITQTASPNPRIFPRL